MKEKTLLLVMGSLQTLFFCGYFKACLSPQHASKVLYIARVRGAALVTGAGELQAAVSEARDCYVCRPVCVINGWVAVPGAAHIKGCLC